MDVWFELEKHPLFCLREFNPDVRLFPSFSPFAYDRFIVSTSSRTISNTISLSDIPTPYLTDPAGHKHHLTEIITKIGRAVENDTGHTNKRVSREHTRIQREGRKLRLEDCRSANSTYLNDECILASVQLRDGDWISSEA